MNSGRIRPAASYALRYTLRIALFFTALVVFAAYLLTRVYSALPDARGTDLMSLAEGSALYVAQFLPLIILAFIAGYHVEGTRGRLAWRIVLNTYLAIVVVFLAGNPDYWLHDVVLDGEANLAVDDLGLSVGTDLVSSMMLCAPLCSALDAVMEYLEKRKGPTPAEEGPE